MGSFQGNWVDLLAHRVATLIQVEDAQARRVHPATPG
eukprot:COSAG05_NODE_357_length_10830_cov_5.181810_4_plen_37_part_00